MFWIEAFVSEWNLRKIRSVQMIDALVDKLEIKENDDGLDDE
jgi:hypothetical protein